MRIYKKSQVSEQARIWQEYNRLYDLSIDNPYPESDETFDERLLKEEDVPEKFLQNIVYHEIAWENIDWSKDNDKIADETGRSIHFVRKMRSRYGPARSTIADSKINWYKESQGRAFYSLFEIIMMMGNKGLHPDAMYSDELEEAKKAEQHGFIKKIVNEDGLSVYVINKDKFREMGWRTEMPTVGRWWK